MFNLTAKRKRLYLGGHGKLEYCSETFTPYLDPPPWAKYTPLTLDFEVCHVTCFDQWISRCDTLGV